MLVYKLRDDGVYLGETMEIEGPGWPANTTPEEPPTVEDDQYVAYIAGEWSVLDKPIPVFNDISKQIENKQHAIALLEESDWVEYPSVSDQTKTPHLSNIGEWIDYRVALREIVINPPNSTIENWPVKPEEEWT